MSLTVLEEFIKSGERCHLVGIGGISVSALAEVLHDMGIPLTGSDVNESQIINKIRKLGIDVTIGHKAESVNGAGYIIRTAAVLIIHPAPATFWAL